MTRSNRALSSLLSRRNALRGAGVCLALPWLESFAPKRASAQAPEMPRRYLPIRFPCGAAAPWWQGAPAFGTGVFGADFVLSPVHEPLAPVKDKLLVLSRIANYSWDSNASGDAQIAPAHPRCSAALGTCVDADRLTLDAGLSPSGNVVNGISADQVIATHTGLSNLSLRESLQLGLGTFPGNFSGRHWAYSQCFSWRSPSEPLKRMVDPQAAFQLLGFMGQDEDALSRVAERKSVIDAVLEDATSLRPQLSRFDQQTVDGFLYAFRELEKRVIAIGQTCGAIPEPAPIPDAPGPLQGLNQGDMGYDRAAHAEVMNDIIAMAFQCDATRVISYLLDDSSSEFDYSFIPEQDRVFGDATAGLQNYYGGGQNGGGQIESVAVDGVYPGTSNAAYATVHRWWVRQVAVLAGKLAAMPEGDGTVLDHTLIHLMSELRSHDNRPWDLPMLLLGGTGFIKQNGHIALAANPSDRQLRDLYYTIQRQYFGLDVTSFGDGPVPNALIEEILA
jgi:hypothetical protein